MTYPHQPHGEPYGGGFGAPPPKRNTGMIVAITVIVATVLGGVAVTGFVAPGFFLSGDEPEPGPTTTTTPTTGSPERTGPEEILETLTDALDSADTETLAEWPCPAAESIVDTVIDSVDVFAGARLVDTADGADGEVVGTIEAPNAGEFELTIIQYDHHGEWCWQDLATSGDPTESPDPGPPSGDGDPTAGGQPVAPEALAAMERFLAAVNAGDTASATAQLCADGITTPTEIVEVIGYQPDLEIDTSMDGLTTDASSVQLYLRGTADGQEVSGYDTNLWMVSYDGPWCVHGFRLVVV